MTRLQPKWKTCQQQHQQIEFYKFTFSSTVSGFIPRQCPSPTFPRQHQVDRVGLSEQSFSLWL